MNNEDLRYLNQVKHKITQKEALLKAEQTPLLVLKAKRKRQIMICALAFLVLFSATLIIKDISMISLILIGMALMTYALKCDLNYNERTFQ